MRVQVVVFSQPLLNANESNHPGLGFVHQVSRVRRDAELPMEGFLVPRPYPQGKNPTRYPVEHPGPLVTSGEHRRGVVSVV